MPSQNVSSPLWWCRADWMTTVFCGMGPLCPGHCILPSRARAQAPRGWVRAHQPVEVLCGCQPSRLPFEKISKSSSLDWGQPRLFRNAHGLSGAWTSQGGCPGPPKDPLKAWSLECVHAQSCLTLATPWTVAHQAPLSMGLPRQDYWSGLPFPSPGDLLDPGIKL